MSAILQNMEHEGLHHTSTSNSNGVSQGRASKTALLAGLAKSGVVYGGTALLSGVNAITPHLAGAVDIMVVEQPDGTYKSSPFYVRFGKYAHLRNKDRSVQITVNGEPAPFQMHLGEYGQAYFVHEGKDQEGEEDEHEEEEEQERLMAEMTSPSSGYSSGPEDEPRSYNAADMLSATALGPGSDELIARLKQGPMAAPGGADSTANGHSLPAPPPLPTATALEGQGPLAQAQAQALPGTQHRPPQAMPLPDGEQGAHLLLLPPSLPGMEGGQSAPPSSSATIPPTSSPAVHVMGFPSPSTLHTRPIASVVPQESTNGSWAPPSNITPMSTSTTTPSGSSPPAVSLLSSCIKAADVSSPPAAAAAPGSHLLSSGCDTQPLGTAAQAPGSGEAQQQADPLAGELPEAVGLMTSLSIDVRADGGGGSSIDLPRTEPPSSDAVGQAGGTLLDSVALTAAAAAALAGVPVVPVAAEAGHGGGEGGEEAGGMDVPVPALAGTSAPDGRAFGDMGVLPAGESVEVMSPMSVRGDTAHGPRVSNPLTHSLSGRPPTCTAARAGAGVGSLTGWGAAGMTLQGMELSMCGGYLRPGCTTYSEAVQLFLAHKVGSAEFARRGAELMAAPELMVRLGPEGVIYPWAAAAPLVLGLAAFGSSWVQLVPAAAPFWAPPGSAAEAHHLMRASSSDGGLGGGVDGGQKEKRDKDKVPSSWRLWPFGGRQAKERGVAETRTPTATPSGTSPPNVQAGSGMELAAAASRQLAASRRQAQEGGAGKRGARVAPGSSPKALATSSMPNPLSRASSGVPPERSSTSPAVRDVAPARALVVVRKTLSPTVQQLGQLGLREGQNVIKYRVGSSTELVAYIYFYHWSTKLVISDIDGTITRSDVLGHLLPAMGWDWSHPGITRLFTDVAANNYQVMYLSSRSISQASITRDYIATLAQGQHRMPVGPVIISPHGLLPSLYREMILRRPHEFKIATLQDIRALFPPDWNPFYAGLGNRDTDEISYREVGVPPSRIFIINPKGELRKATLAIQSSTWNSLAAINDLVHDIFPPIARVTPLSALPPLPTPTPSEGGASRQGSAAVPAQLAPSPVPSLTPTQSAGGSDPMALPTAPTPEPATPTSASEPAPATAVEGSANGMEGLSPKQSGFVPLSEAAPAPAPPKAAPAATTTAAATDAPQPRPHPHPHRTNLTSPKAAIAQLYSAAAAEGYNDLTYWSNLDNMAAMAADIDSLEAAMVVHPKPPLPPPASKLAPWGRPKPPAPSAMEAAAGAAGQGAGVEGGSEEEFVGDDGSLSLRVSDDGEEYEDEGEGQALHTGRSSSDFLSTYNPFAT